MHSLDDASFLRSIVLDFTLRFDDVLDPEKLSAALVRLMELGNWRKLGAGVGTRRDAHAGVGHRLNETQRFFEALLALREIGIGEELRTQVGVGDAGPSFRIEGALEHRLRGAWGFRRNARARCWRGSG